MSKAEVIAQYEKDFRDFLSAVHQIPEARKTDRILEQWGIKQILDHVASWNLETVKAIEKVVSGDIPWFFDHQDEVDIFNGEQIEKRKQIFNQNIFAEMEASHRTLLEFLHQFPDSLFHQSSGKIWHQEAVTPALVCSYRHYAVHRQDIVRYLEQQPNTLSIKARHGRQDRDHKGRMCRTSDSAPYTLLFRGQSADKSRETTDRAGFLP